MLPLYNQLSGGGNACHQGQSDELESNQRSRVNFEHTHHLNWKLATRQIWIADR